MPAFAEFFNTLNLWSPFAKTDSILNCVGEGYQPEKLTKENFLKLYKEKNHIVSEGDYYVKADITYFYQWIL